MKMIREKKHRLPIDFYIGEKIVSFTMCIKNSEKIFTEECIFIIFRDKLMEAIRQSSCEAIIYLFMPDHLHLILEGSNKNSNVIKAADTFKQKTGFWFSRNRSYTRWQKDYHDHIIRNHEDLKNHIYYILNNPVRRGIVNHWKEYQFRGSSVYDFDKWE